MIACLALPFREGNDMAEPYVSSRQGSTQWFMQRASALLLLFLAFGHFALQHFTSDAVSTGLTVAARMNEPWWQAYYAVFITLALYHGVNGLVGIIRDYNPKTSLRVKGEILLWTIAILFGALGIRNVLNPTPLAAVKESYAARGFPAGISHGNPPALGIAYDFRDELRELKLLEHYLGKYVHGVKAEAIPAIFGTPSGAPTPANVAATGKAFDAWCLAVIAKGRPKADDRDPHWVFASTFEFAWWAANVRKADALSRGDAATRDRLQSVPDFIAAAAR